MLLKKHFTAAVIVAAGVSKRYGKNKLLEDIGGMPVIARSYLAFESSPMIDGIVVVCEKESLSSYRDIIMENGGKKLLSFVCGGETRMESVLNGLSVLPQKCDFVAVHDGARPLITGELIEKTVRESFLCGAAIPVSKPTATLKKIKNGAVSETVDREEIFSAETPQCFNKNALCAALLNAEKKGISVTDDSMALEIMGFKPKIILNESCNIKITRPDDMIIARAVWEARRNEDR